MHTKNIRYNRYKLLYINLINAIKFKKWKFEELRNGFNLKLSNKKLHEFKKY